MPPLKTFAYHKPSQTGLDKINQLRVSFSQMQSLINELCPDSREKSVTMTHLETTAMWAIKSVVFNDPKSEVE